MTIHVMICGVAESGAVLSRSAHCWRLTVLLESFPYIALYLTGSLVVDGVLAQSLAYYVCGFLSSPFVLRVVALHKVFGATKSSQLLLLLVTCEL